MRKFCVPIFMLNFKNTEFKNLGDTCSDFVPLKQPLFYTYCTLIILLVQFLPLNSHVRGLTISRPWENSPNGEGEITKTTNFGC